MQSVPVYIFSCDRVGNIENGLKAKLWAVNEWKGNRASLASRAVTMKNGTFGQLYSSSKTARGQQHAFKAAFMTTSLVDLDREEKDVFQILGYCLSQLSRSLVAKKN